MGDLDRIIDQAMIRAGNSSWPYRRYVKEYVKEKIGRLSRTVIDEGNRELFSALVAETLLHAGLRYQVVISGATLQPYKIQAKQAAGGHSAAIIKFPSTLSRRPPRRR